MTIRGILFDKDGTLIDFDQTWVPAYDVAAAAVARRAARPELAARLLAAGGRDPASGRIDPESMLAWGATTEIVERWAAAAGLADNDLLAAEIAAIFDATATGNPVALADLDSLFTRLTASGYRLGVATMDGEQSARAMLAACGALAHLDFVAGHDSGHGAKPDAGMVVAFCRALGLTPAEVAVVGDTPSDLKMARAAGAGLAIGVLTGLTPAAQLAPLADHLLASVAKLETVLG